MEHRRRRWRLPGGRRTPFARRPGRPSSRPASPPANRDNSRYAYSSASHAAKATTRCLSRSSDPEELYMFTPILLSVTSAGGSRMQYPHHGRHLWCLSKRDGQRQSKCAAYLRHALPEVLGRMWARVQAPTHTLIPSDHVFHPSPRHLHGQAVLWLLGSQPGSVNMSPLDACSCRLRLAQCYQGPARRSKRC